MLFSRSAFLLAVARIINIAADPAFNMTLEDLQKTMDPAKYVGRSVEQVDAFLKNVIRPILEKNKELLGVKAVINV